MKAVTPDARGKERLVLIDCVGVCDHALVDSLPLERNLTVGLEKLLDAVKAGSIYRDLLTSLAVLLARIRAERAIEQEGDRRARKLRAVRSNLRQDAAPGGQDDG
jgi:hypothetical protein